MPKWIGNRIGDDAQAPDIASAGGVFGLIDQFWGKSNPTISWADTSLGGRFTVTNGTKIIDVPNDHVYTLFSSSGSVAINPGPSLQCEYVVVGGGGGGGNANFTGSYNYAGGGGAGGFRTGTMPTVTAGATYPVSIGAGGIPPTGGQTTPQKPAGRPGTNGAATTWNSITSEGGGCGGGGAPGVDRAKGVSGGSGGSHGGYGYPTQPSGNMVVGTSTPVPAQGNPGSTAPSGGGGGGAGGSGNPPTSSAGAGGAGLVAYATPGTYVPYIPTDFGAPGPTTGRWFSAGGGAGAIGYAGAAGGAGGAGGGGGGGITNAVGSDATVKSGGGGGGAGRDSGPTTPANKNKGGNAGDGVVLIRWYE